MPQGNALRNRPKTHRILRTILHRSRDFRHRLTAGRGLVKAVFAASGVPDLRAMTTAELCAVRPGDEISRHQATLALPMESGDRLHLGQQLATLAIAFLVCILHRAKTLAVFVQEVGSRTGTVPSAMGLFERTMARQERSM